MSAAGSRESRKSLKTRLTDFFDIEHPILSAPMALISGGRLSAAVTSAGGLGLIGGGYGDSDWLQREFGLAEGMRLHHVESGPQARAARRDAGVATGDDHVVVR